MRVLIVNTSERIGGAAVAANRLTEALNNNGVKAKMLVRDKQTESLTVIPLPPSWLQKWHFLWERLLIFYHLHFSKNHLFELDIANCGSDITKLPEFIEADVIHLHWINQGMLSLQTIRKILKSGKPVVWTMHDLWPATAICHLSLGCQQFMTRCQHCKYLPNGGSEHDLAAKTWSKKKKTFSSGNISFVTCSHWLEGEAKRSALLKDLTITSIPNPIDTHFYCPGEKNEVRRKEGLPTDKKMILCVCQRLTNRNKGMQYLVEACNQLAQKNSEMCENTGILLLGSHAEELAEQLPFHTYPLGYISDERRIVNIYRAADLFVLPSLSENLPNTIMEAMACGVPCLAFRIGGIPEEIDHKKNGYLAKYEDSTDLADGIRWILFDSDYEQLSRQCVTKVARNYSQSSVSIRYIEIYQHAIAQNHFRL